MTPPQLFLIKEQIIIPFGFPFALFGNWKKVILTEATVLIFWLYLIRQTVCPKKYTLEVSLDRCVWSVLISELYSLSPLSTKKYSTFLLLSQFISQESSDQIIFLNFRLQFYKKIRIWTAPPQTLFGLNDTCQICFDFVCRIQIKKSHNEPHDLQKKNS
jgi:hypothetical protein